MANHLLIRYANPRTSLQIADIVVAYYVTKLLLFRPFLLLCLELKRRGIKDILSERNGGVEMTVLFEAAEHSVSAAKDIIAFCDSLFSLQIGIEVCNPKQRVRYLVLTMKGIVLSRFLPRKCVSRACPGCGPSQQPAFVRLFRNALYRAATFAAVGLTRACTKHQCCS